MKAGFLLGAILGWFVGGMCIELVPEPTETEDRVYVSFYSSWRFPQEVDVGGGPRPFVVDSRYDVVITRNGRTGLDQQVRIVFFLLRTVIGGLTGAVLFASLRPRSPAVAVAVSS
jgi:hypothetical protein